MSKMFDALRRAQGETAVVGSEILRRAEHASFAAPAAVERDTEDTAAIDNPPAAKTYRRVARVEPGFSAATVEPEDHRALEQYRLIRTKILHHPRKPKVIALTSPGPGDGKTTTSINLAGVLALRDEMRVLLVDADLRRSTLANTLGLPTDIGLANLLAGEVSETEAILQMEEHSNLFILPAGSANGVNPAELFDSTPWHRACAYFREHFDVVIFDTPPVATVADSELVLQASDGVVIVVRMDHTDRTVFDTAVEAIPRDKLLGVVLNCAYDWFLWKTNDYTYYYSRRTSKKPKGK